MHHFDLATLEAGLAHVRAAPATDGVVELIVRRPKAGEREVCESASLDEAEGLVGDCWRARGSRHTLDGSAEPERQLTIMSSRAIALMAASVDQWPLAGDQLYVDLDLSEANLPAGVRVAVGDAIIEISSKPHTGCAKFRARFGADALRFVNSPDGRALRLRGVNGRVVRSGAVRAGDAVRRIGA
jgi:MOSC domain-containing protein YiiM